MKCVDASHLCDGWARRHCLLSRLPFFSGSFGQFYRLTQQD